MGLPDSSLRGGVRKGVRLSGDVAGGESREVESTGVSGSEVGGAEPSAALDRGSGRGADAEREESADAAPVDDR